MTPRHRLDRRDFLKLAGLTAGMSLDGFRPRPAGAALHLGDRFVQQVDHAELYMTHYALFEEPDPGIVQGIYIDAATGQPTNELFLTPPLVRHAFRRAGRNPTELVGTSDTSKLLPYIVEPPGFPPQAPPPPIVGLIQSITGLPAAVVATNTEILLVAIGRFVADGVTTARLRGANFEVSKIARFEVRIRTGFLFEPPAGIPAPPVGVLVGFLDFGLLHQLIQLPPPPNPSDLVVYTWRAPMTLSTDGSYVRATATEPPPVAEAFPPGLGEVRFQGARVDNDGRYTIVGSARPADVQFIAPPELELFLFGVTSLADVEFAVLERGRLLPGS
jgi:hypothetical protein